MVRVEVVVDFSTTIGGLERYPINPTATNPPATPVTVTRKARRENLLLDSLGHLLILAA